MIRFYRALFNYCLRKVKDRDTAFDLTQESYARVLSMERAGHPALDPLPLLKQVALHIKIDMDRRAEVRRHDDIDSLDESALPAQPSHLQPDEVCATTQIAQAYFQAIEKLPPRCREAFCMYAFEGIPNKEIAQRMGISISMVDKYIGRAKEACLVCRESLDGTSGKK